MDKSSKKVDKPTNNEEIFNDLVDISMDTVDNADHTVDSSLDFVDNSVLHQIYEILTFLYTTSTPQWIICLILWIT